MTKTIKFTFQTPTVIEEWVAGKHKKGAVDLVRATFKNGSIFSGDGEEVARLVTPHRPISNCSILQGNKRMCLMRLEGRELDGHTFMREFTVAKIPAGQADQDAHAENGAFLVKTIRKVLRSSLADLNKMRAALCWRAEMKSYEGIYNTTLPGISDDEAAFLTKARIFNLMQEKDIAAFIQGYEKLYEPGCIGQNSGAGD